MTFPPDFQWGVATAGYQVEGTITNNDWALFVNDPGIRERVRQLGAFRNYPIHLQDPGAAILHSDLRVFEADLDRAVALGATAYRMSVEWSRLQPQDPQAPTASMSMRADGLDAAGVQFYEDRIAAVLKHNLTLHLTLNHFTHPLWVLTPSRASTRFRAGLFFGPHLTVEDEMFRQHRGWESSLTIQRFVAYARAVIEYYEARFGPGKIFWSTFNEPVGSLIGIGYLAGIWPPGFSLAATRARRAYFNIIRAHLLMYEWKMQTHPQTQIGIVHAMLATQRTQASSPGTGARIGASVGGVVGAVLGLGSGGLRGMLAGAAAGAGIGAGGGALTGIVRDIHEEARQQFDYFFNWHLLDALLTNQVDVALAAHMHRRCSLDRTEFVSSALLQDLNTMITPGPKLDFLGINYYRLVHLYYDPLFQLLVPYAGGVFDMDVRSSTEEHTLVNDLAWEIFPDGLRQLVTQTHQNYSRPGRALPLFVTENGYPESVDRHRAPYLNAHVDALHAAMQQEDARLGPPQVRGYFCWTLVDNYEWHEAYRPESRFGLFRMRNTPDSRAITEGAFAFHRIACTSAIKGAMQGFGAITSDGRNILPPTQSPGAMWIGDIDAEPIRLWFIHVESSQIEALLFYPRYERWIRIEQVVFNKAQRAVRFAHDEVANLPARTFVATITGHQMHGTCVTQAAGVPVSEHHWVAEREILAGVWMITTDSIDQDEHLLSLTRWEGDRWQGKFLRPPQPWVAISDLTETTKDGVRTLNWSTTPKLQYTAEVCPDATPVLQGLIRDLDRARPGSSPLRFAGHRLPDGLPF